MAKDRYVGVVPPIVTPVDEFERVDEAALRGIVRRCKDGFMVCSLQAPTESAWL